MANTIRVVAEIATNGWLLKDCSEYSDNHKQVETELPIALEYLANRMTGGINPDQMLAIITYFQTKLVEAARAKPAEPAAKTEDADIDDVLC